MFPIFTHPILTSISHRRALILILFVLAMGAIACDAVRPIVGQVASREVIRRDVVFTDEFDAVGRWDVYDGEGVQMLVEDGAFLADVDGGQYIYSLSGYEQDDVTVDIETQFLGGDDQSGYGVICRATRGIVGSGYYFLISADGAYTIRRGQGREVDALVAWSRSTAIDTGSQINAIRAVCVDDYLALYINGEFVAEARDDLYSGGYVGVAVVGRRDQTLRVQFDNLFVWASE